MDNEKKVSAEEMAQRKKDDGKVTKLNDESYKDKNIESIEQIKTKFRDAKGKDREKIVERVIYHNGVVKNRLIAVLKEGRLVYKVAGKTMPKKRGKKAS